jgi:hypothetical protein
MGRKAQKPGTKSLHRTATIIIGTAATHLVWDVQADASHVLRIDAADGKDAELYFANATALRLYTRSHYGRVRWAPGLRGGFGIRPGRKGKARR